VEDVADVPAIRLFAWTCRLTRRWNGRRGFARTPDKGPARNRYPWARGASTVCGSDAPGGSGSASTDRANLRALSASMVAPQRRARSISPARAMSCSHLVVMCRRLPQGFARRALGSSKRGADRGVGPRDRPIPDERMRQRAARASRLPHPGWGTRGAARLGPHVMLLKAEAAWGARAGRHFLRANIAPRGRRTMFHRPRSLTASFGG
jgi:hypothetical protein